MQRSKEERERAKLQDAQRVARRDVGNMLMSVGQFIDTIDDKPEVLGSRYDTNFVTEMVSEDKKRTSGFERRIPKNLNAMDPRSVHSVSLTRWEEETASEIKGTISQKGEDYWVTFNYRKEETEKLEKQEDTITRTTAIENSYRFIGDEKVAMMVFMDTLLMTCADPDSTISNQDLWNTFYDDFEPDPPPEGGEPVSIFSAKRLGKKKFRHLRAA